MIENTINTELEEVLTKIENIILDELEYLEVGYGMTKTGLNKRLNIDLDILTVCLKRLRNKGIIELAPLWDEQFWKPNGSGYWLTSKNK